MTRSHGFGTRSIHAGEAPDPATGAHGTPIYQNATYAFRSFEGLEAWREGAPHFMYAREGNPTVRCLELKLANLDGAESAVAAASGMAAISATLLHLLGGGGHLVASADLYGTTLALLRQDLPAFGATVDLVDITDLVAVEKAIGPNTRAIFTESFSNPLLRVAVCGRRGPVAEMAGLLSRLGGAMSPFNAWLLLAGVKTLPLRIERHCANASALAALLAAHPAVATAHYPGLPSHPQHELARKLVGDRFGGMLAFSLHGGAPAAGRMLNRLDLATIAVSLGDPATLAWPMAGSDLVRLSVGLEDWADLEADFINALAHAGTDAAAAPPSPSA
jgi:O-acetylhomoserine/O-acetylserine sulfhydrylase-like pyridoxal-dependent enzyme